MDDFLKQYYGTNYDKAIENAKSKRAEMKSEFLKKYPNADLSKFDFEVDLNKDGTVQSTSIYFKNSDILSTDITSSTFLNDKTMTKYLYSNTKHNIYPEMWKIGWTVQKLPRGKRHVGFYGKPYYWDEFPAKYILEYPINKFRVYVNNTDYFMSDLLPLNITTKNTAKWNLKESYYQTIVGTWIATYASRISIKHSTFSPDVPKQITSLMIFYLYFTVRRIMKEFQTLSNNRIQYIMNKYNANFLLKTYIQVDLARNYKL